MLDSTDTAALFSRVLCSFSDGFQIINISEIAALTHSCQGPSSKYETTREPVITDKHSTDETRASLRSVNNVSASESSDRHRRWINAGIDIGAARESLPIPRRPQFASYDSRGRKRKKGETKGEEAIRREPRIA